MRSRARTLSRVTPTITVRNLQRRERVAIKALQNFAERALSQCLRLRTKKGSLLGNLANIDVVLISDRRMADLHRRFLHRAGPTDVITFQHGEILVSTEAARRHAQRFGNSLARELQLYVAHGLLHLHGFDDTSAAAARKMEATQKRILSAIVKIGAIDRHRLYRRRGAPPKP